MPPRLRLLLTVLLAARCRTLHQRWHPAEARVLLQSIRTVFGKQLRTRKVSVPEKAIEVDALLQHAAFEKECLPPWSAHRCLKLLDAHK